MVTTVTEFIYFRLKPEIKPEDPENEGGKQFLDIVRSVKESRGFQAASWGRTVEDENDIVWAIDWDESTCGFNLSSLTPLLAPSSSPITFHSTLIPPTASTINANPTNEIIVLAFPSSFNSPEGKQSLESDLANFRKKMLELPDGALSFSIGWFARPAVVKHQDSPTGAALLNALVIGWNTVEDHMAAKETTEFAKGVRKIRENILSPVEGLEMRHVTFHSI